MKMLFMLVSIICALAISALSFIIATGSIPFAEAPEQQVITVMAQPKAPLTVFSGQKEIIDVLIADLKAKNEDYEKRLAALKDREEALKVMENLQSEMASLKTKFDTVILEVKTSEQANFKRLADIFSKMDSENAASLLQQMEKDRAAVILNIIGERQAGAIMNAAVQAPDGAAAAAEWSDAIRRLKAEKKGG